MQNTVRSFVFALPAPGRYRVRAERIGYAGLGSPLLEVGESETRDYRLQVRSAPIALEGIRATGTRRCTPGPNGGAGTAALWEEARKALNAAALTQEEEWLRFSLLRYERELELPGLRVVREQVKRTTGISGAQYGARPTAELSRRGYVEQVGDTVFYHAPDARVLLSDLFLEEHCFGVRDGEEGRVGLSFRPVPGRKLPDVSGVLWLDRGTGELRKLEYTYANLEFTAPKEQLGGRMEFQRLPSDDWYIPHWRIRMPLFGVRRDLLGRRLIARRKVVAVREDAGEVEEVRSPVGELIRSAARGSLTGAVWDSTRHAPLAGAQVRLVGTPYDSEADREGRYRIENVPAGRYTATFTHPRVDSLGYVPEPQPVELIVGSDRWVRLAVPSLPIVLASACPKEPGAGRGMVVGRVYNLASLVDLSDAEVVISRQQTDSVPAGQVEVRSDAAEGRYRACSVPAGIPLQAEASFLDGKGRQYAMRAAAGVPTEQNLELHSYATDVTAPSGRVSGASLQPALVRGRILNAAVRGVSRGGSEVIGTIPASPAHRSR